MIHQYEITMSNTACIHCVKLEFCFRIYVPTEHDGLSSNGRSLMVV